MTREEFNRKAQAGTLTVGEIRDNLRFATPEQLAAAGTAPVADVFDKLTATAQELHGIRADLERLELDVYVAGWESMAGDPQR